MARLLNVIRDTSREKWYGDYDGKGNVMSEDGILYGGELAWLYNEFGLAAYFQGALHDAYARFRSGQDINKVVERHTHHQHWLQSGINFALVQIERGRLLRSRYHLENVINVACKNKDEEFRARALGYLGLVNHLSGDYGRAAKQYERALESLTESGNARGVSMFLRHSSDLERLRGNLQEAHAKIVQSIAAAESGRHADLVHYGRVASANLYRHLSEQKGSKARAVHPEFLETALDYAKRIGIPKLEADVYRVHGLIALDQGETRIAAHLAMRCLSIASLFGMRLRLVASLVFLGQVARARGNEHAAVKILRSSIRLAEQQGYVLQIERAEEELTRIPREAKRGIVDV